MLQYVYYRYSIQFSSRSPSLDHLTFSAWLSSLFLSSSLQCWVSALTSCARVEVTSDLELVIFPQKAVILPLLTIGLSRFTLYGMKSDYKQHDPSPLYWRSLFIKPSIAPGTVSFLKIKPSTHFYTCICVYVRILLRINCHKDKQVKLGS